MNTQELTVLAHLVDPARPYTLEVVRERRQGKEHCYYSFRRVGRPSMADYLATRLINNLLRKQYIQPTPDGGWLVPTEAARDLIGQLPSTTRDRLTAA